MAVDRSSAKSAQPVGVLARVGRELVVGDIGRDGGDQADGGGEQRLGDRRGHHGQRGVLRQGDVLEGVHDAPDRAEQADEQAGGGDDGRGCPGLPRPCRSRARSGRPSSGRCAGSGRPAWARRRSRPWRLASRHSFRAACSMRGSGWRGFGAGLGRDLLSPWPEPTWSSNRLAAAFRAGSGTACR